MQAGYAVAGSLGELRPIHQPILQGGNGAVFGTFPLVFITTPPPQAAFAMREA